LVHELEAVPNEKHQIEVWCEILEPTSVGSMGQQANPVPMGEELIKPILPIPDSIRRIHPYKSPPWRLEAVLLKSQESLCRNPIDNMSTGATHVHVEHE
jgi:hypothetical protein